MPDFLTVKEVAERLNVNRQTVYEWCWSGHLPHKRFGPSGRMIRISEEDLNKYIKRAQHDPMRY